MTIKEAEEIKKTFLRKTNPTEDEFFAFSEAMAFLIEKNKNPADMMTLGGVYYEMRNFDLALKYYEMAAGYDYEEAYNCLGYIWYYGRTGEKDYEKAFRCFSRSAELGNIESEYKLADMYKNGYWVERDYEKYKEIIKGLYPKVRDAHYLGEPLPEIFTRLAKIYTKEGRIDEAAELYYIAKDFLAQRIHYNPFFGNLSIMSRLIDELYELVDFDEDSFDFYDLYYLLKAPCEVSFRYKNKSFSLKAVNEEEGFAISFNGKWFRGRDDFFKKACIGRELLTSLCDDFYMFEVIR